MPNIFSCSVVFIFLPLVLTDDVFTNRFADIRFTHAFVDKTAMIREIFYHKHLFLNAPSGFGKSSNIGMLNLFLSNLRTKETIEEYFRDTEIWKDQEFVGLNAGEHPVILYNISVFNVIHDEEHMNVALRYTMYNTFKDHHYLLKSPNVTVADRDLLEHFLRLKIVQCLKVDVMMTGLRFLAHLLYQHHGKPVILLSDGFGHGGIERILQENNDFKYLSPKLLEWYSTLIKNTLLDQDIISHSVVTGETFLYGLKDPAFSVFQPVPFMETNEFREYFGFTVDEVRYLLKEYDISAEESSKFIKWYCGYSSRDGQVKICNPVSVITCLRSDFKRIRVYWWGSPTGPDILQRIVDAQFYRKYLLDLAVGKNVSIDLGSSRVPKSVGYFRKQVERLDADSKDFIFGLLKETGYVSYSGEQPSEGVSLRIPTEEIRSVVDKFISLLSFI